MDSTRSRSRRADNTNILSGTASRIGKAPWTSNRFMRMMVNKKAGQKVMKPRRWGLRNPEEYFNHADSPGSLRSFIHESPTPPQRQPRDNVLPGQYDVYERNSNPHSSMESEHRAESEDEDAQTADYISSQTPPLVRRIITQETVPVHPDVVPLADVSDGLSDHEEWVQTSHSGRERRKRLIYNSPVRVGRDAVIGKRLNYTTYARDPVTVMDGTPRRKFYTIRAHKSLPIDEYTVPSSPAAMPRQAFSPYNRKSHAIALPVDRLDDGIGMCVKDPGLDSAGSQDERCAEEEGYVSDGDNVENQAPQKSRFRSGTKEMPRRRSSTLPGGSVLYHPGISEDQEEYIDVEQYDSPSPIGYEEASEEYVRPRQGNVFKHQREDQSGKARGRRKTPQNLHLQPLADYVQERKQLVTSRAESPRVSKRKSEPRKDRKSESDVKRRVESELLQPQIDTSTESRLDYEDSDSDSQRRSFQFEKARRGLRNSYAPENSPDMPPFKMESESVEGSENEAEINFHKAPQESDNSTSKEKTQRDTEWDLSKSAPRSSRKSGRHTLSSVQVSNQELVSPQSQQGFHEDITEESEDEVEPGQTSPRTSKPLGKTGETRRRTRVSCSTESDIQKESDAQAPRPHKRGKYSLRASTGSTKESQPRDSEISEKSLPDVEATCHSETKTRKSREVSLTKSPAQVTTLEREKNDEEQNKRERRERNGATSTPNRMPRSKKKRRHRICYRSPSRSRKTKSPVKQAEKGDPATLSTGERKSSRSKTRTAEESISANRSSAPPGSERSSKRKSIMKPMGLSINITPISGDSRRVSFAPNCGQSPGIPSCHSTPLVRQKTQTHRVKKHVSTQNEEDTDSSDSSELHLQNIFVSPSSAQLNKGGKLRQKTSNQGLAFKYPYKLVREEGGSEGYAFCYFKPKDVQQMAEEATPGLRRSKRTRVPRLCRWRGDQVEYEYTKEGKVVKSIRLGMKKPEEPKKKSGKKQKSAKELCEELKNANIETNPRVPVLTLEGIETEEDVICTEEMMNLTKHGAGLFVHKFFRDSDFGYGKLEIGPKAEKSRQQVKRDRMVFFLSKGRIMLTIHTSAFELKTGAAFNVPPGNTYSIKNLENSKAVLLFAQFKAKE